MLLQHQRVEMVGEGRWAVLQQGGPRRQLKRCEDDPFVEAAAAVVAQLQVMGATVAGIPGQGALQAAQAIAMQLQAGMPIEQQLQIAVGLAPAVNHRPLQAMQPAAGPVRPAALQALQLPVALPVQALGAATQFNRPLRCVDPGPQHTAARTAWQGPRQGGLQKKAAGQVQPLADEVIALQMGQ